MQEDTEKDADLHYLNATMHALAGSFKVAKVYLLSTFNDRLLTAISIII